jgi:hypothetical protein
MHAGTQGAYRWNFHGTGKDSSHDILHYSYIRLFRLEQIEQDLTVNWLLDRDRSWSVSHLAVVLLSLPFTPRVSSPFSVSSFRKPNITTTVVSSVRQCETSSCALSELIPASRSLTISLGISTNTLMVFAFSSKRHVALSSISNVLRQRAS